MPGQLREDRDKKAVMVDNYDVIIIGAGAAGLMCAITAGRRKKKVLLLERNKKPGAKILISGGGRCNFTNLNVVPAAYISQNRHFAKSALSRYTAWDFMELLGAHGLTWHEKTLGQLFCDQGAKAILKVLLDECSSVGVQIKLGADVTDIKKNDEGFRVHVPGGTFRTENLVIAAGGVSIPQMGATDFAYRIARQFDLKMIQPAPALVPLVFDRETVDEMKALAGVAADANVWVSSRASGPPFRENILFTHRGLSGPAILQISSYWHPGEALCVNLLPDEKHTLGWLKDMRDKKGGSSVKTVLSTRLAERLADQIATAWPGKLGELSNISLEALSERLSSWRLLPTGTEGFKKAEVTKGGVSTDELSSKTMEARSVPGLYFIGECVDVTGWLGGYNFQWAWASGHAAGEAVN